MNPNRDVKIGWRFVLGGLFTMALALVCPKALALILASFGFFVLIIGVFAVFLPKCLLIGHQGEKYCKFCGRKMKNV